MSGTTSVAPADRRSRRWMGSRQIVALVIGVVAIVFIAQNRGRVQIDLFWVSLSAPVWLLLTLMVLAGMAVSALLRRKR